MTDDENREQLCVRISIGCELCGIRFSDYDDSGNAKFRDRDVGIIVVTVGEDWTVPYCRLCAHRLFSHKKVVETIGAYIEIWKVDANQRGERCSEN